MNSVPRVRAPKGYSFRVVSYEQCTDADMMHYCPGNVYVELLNNSLASNKKVVGRVTLEKYRSGSYMTHSWLNSKYWNKGLGTKIYARAIQWCHDNNYRVRSSGYSSDMAARVWSGDGIRKLFKITERRTRSNTANKTWFAYSRA